VIHPKNNLNELTNTQWMIDTKSVWFSKPPKRDKKKTQHPATFCESDIIRLIQFFSKTGEKVLDPFLGSGTTLVSCAQSDRKGTGIEIIEKWAKLSEERLESFDTDQKIIRGDALQTLKTFVENSYDFIVTSPPYWMILNKDDDHKARAERTSKGLTTKYSEESCDYGNIKSYDEFLKTLGCVFAECARVLKKKKYMCVIVSDFRHKSDFIAYHADISRVVEENGLKLEGITILAQDSKGLYPYGLPYAYVSNIHHQYILIFRKK
jgi:DNA modification methylase